MQLESETVLSSVVALCSNLGVRVYVNGDLGVEWTKVQFKFPRSKKRRIRKKFEKDKRNFKLVRKETPVCYRVGTALVVNPLFWKMLKEYADAAETKP